MAAAGYRIDLAVEIAGKAPLAVQAHKAHDAHENERELQRLYAPGVSATTAKDNTHEKKPAFPAITCFKPLKL